MKLCKYDAPEMSDNEFIKCFGIAIIMIIIGSVMMLNAYAAEENFYEDVFINIDGTNNKINVVTEDENKTYNFINGTNASHSFNTRIRRNVSSCTDLVDRNFTQAFLNMEKTCNDISDATSTINNYYEPYLQCERDRTQCQTENVNLKADSIELGTVKEQQSSCLSEKTQLDSQLQNAQNNVNRLSINVTNLESQLGTTKGRSNIYLLIAVVAGIGLFYYWNKERNKTSQHPTSTIGSGGRQ